jgi:hypothetical protein
MSQNIAKSVFLKLKGYANTKLILKTIMVMIAIFGLVGTNLPFVKAAPTSGSDYIVNDIGDPAYKPTADQSVGLNGTAFRTLRWAIEQVNRDCATSIATPTIKFDFAGMKFNGAAVPATTSPVSDTAGKYSVGADSVYRIPLNTYLPDLICAGTVIDGMTGNPNAPTAIGSGANVGAGKGITVNPKIQRPAIEIYPKSIYVRPVSVKEATAGFTGTNQWAATRNCGLRAVSETIAIKGIAIFGFGGGEYNDANICVGPYSNAAPLTQPDPRVTNPEADVTTDYFPQVNAISNAFINGAVVDFLGGNGDETVLGVGINKYDSEPSIYENLVVHANNDPFAGKIRGVDFSSDEFQNTTDVKITNNVIGATAELKAPADPTFTGTYDTAKAVAMRDKTYHSQGSGISVVASDAGSILNNIIAFNGGVTGLYGGQSSASGVLFDVAAYVSGNPPVGVNTYTEAAAQLNAESWDIINNEVYLNITNDRSFGGNGIFSNSNMNGAPGDGSFTIIDKNDVYQNGGAGIRTFVPAIHISGNKINDNGQHTNSEDPTYNVIEKTAGYNIPRSYVPTVESFKHGIWMECGDGYIYQNAIYQNKGAAVAVAGGNMYCPNGGLTQQSGNEINENSMYDNGSIGIDLYKENNAFTKEGVNAFPVYDKAPTNTVEYEKVIGSENDIDSQSQKTGDASTFQGTNGSKFVSLNTSLALRQVSPTNPVSAFQLATADPLGISPAPTNERALVGANLNIPFPVFTYATLDCSTNKVILHGYVSKGANVEVFTPDKLTVETYAEGKTYLFDFSDDNANATAAYKDTDTDVGTYSNTTAIVGENNLPLSAGTINDLPWYDAATGTLKTLSTATPPFATVDKVHGTDVMEADLAHEFTVQADSLKVGDIINATATESASPQVGVTSEFSPNFLVKPINICPSASIVKSWDAGVNPQPYAAGDTLSFTITVYNESTTSVLDGFTVKDGTFDADVDKSLSCTPVTPGLPAGPFNQATMAAGVSFKPTTPIAIGGKQEFKCTEKVIAAPLTVAPAVITNKAVLAPFDPLQPKTLSIVKPKTGNTTAKDQTDGVTSATVNDITNTEDSITATPVSAKKLISVVKSWVTDPVSYSAGTKLDFNITITNEGTTPVTKFNLADDNFGGLATGMACDNGFTTFAGQDITLVAPLAPKAVLVIKCTGVLAPAPAGTLTNKATLKPATGDLTTNVVMPQTLTQSDKDPKTALTVIDTPQAQSDSISVPPAGSASASIVKAWKTKPATYAAGTDLSFSITIVNEGTVPLVDFNLDDDSFAKNANVKITTCDNPLFVAPYAAQVIKPATPIAPKGTFVVNCTASAIAAGTTALTNTATLAKGTAALTVVKPTGTQQSDEDPSTQSTTDFTKDSITVPGVPLVPSYYIIKKITTTPNEYKAGSPLAYDIEIVNSTPSVKILEVKMTDDCGAGKLVPCTYTPATGTYDATTKIFKGMTWVASADGKTSSVIIKSTGIVIAGTTGNITNTAKLDKTHPIDPAFPLVFPVCKKDPTMPAQSDAADADVCDDKVVTPPAGSPKASIIKAFAPTKVDATYKLNTVVDYIITIVNEGTVDITEFNLLDDSFAGKVLPDTCVGDFSYKVGAAADVILKAPLAPKGKVSITCTGKAPASDGTTTLVNTVTLAGTAKTPLSVVAPSGTPQSDGKQTDPADIPKDSISIPPAPKDASPVMSIRKVLTSGKKTFAPLDTITYDVVVTKISGNITVVKVDDDCAGGLLEGTVPGTPCTITSANPTTYTAGTGTVATGTSGTLSGVTWPASNEVVFKVTGVVKAGTKTDVKNIATLDFKVPANPLDPANPTQLAVCAIDPKMTRDDKTIPTAADCNTDNVIITPVPTVPTISIRKVLTSAKTFKPGDTVTYDVIITKIGGTVTQVKITDDCGGNLLEGATAGSPCTVTSADGTFDAATLTLTAIKWSAANEAIFKVTGKVKAGTTTNVTNVATFDPKFPADPANPTVLPVCSIDPKMTRDDKTVPTAADCNKDNVIITPAPTPIYTIKKTINSLPNQYAAGEELYYTIRITNWTPAIPIKQVKLIDDCGAGLLENCILTPAPNTAYDTTTNILSGMVWTPDASGKSSSTTVTYSGKVKATTTTNIANTAKLDPTLPIDPLNPSVLPVCATDPKMQDFTNSDGTIKVCEDDVITPPTPVLSIRKVLTSSKTTFAPGDTITYDVIVTKNAGNVVQVKVSDDCGGGKLEGTPVAPATTAPCTITSADGTFDPATGILTGAKWSATNEVVFKVSGKVKAGTTTDVVNVAKFDPNFPADPKNPLVLPVCAIDPKMTNADPASPEKCTQDEVKITPTPIADKASIVKAWNFYTGYFTKGDTLAWTVTVTNEGTTDLTKFKIKDDNFAAAPELDATSFLCKTKTAAPAFTSAQMLAGFDFVPTTPLKPGEFVQFACTVDVATDGIEGDILENTATLKPAAGQELTRVVPTKLQQSDLDVSTQEEIDTDHLYVEPEVFIPLPPAASIIKRWTGKNGTSQTTYYEVGDKLEFEIIIGNEGGEDIRAFTLQDDVFDNATNLSVMVCDQGFTNFKGQDFELETPIKPEGNFVIKCNVTVTAESYQTLKNTVTLIFPEGDIYQPDVNIKGRESGQSDGLVGDPANDAIDSIKISPKPKTIVPVLVTPRTGGQIAIGVSILALVSVAFLTLRKKVTAKK